MGFRITTNMMMNTYRYNLQNSTKKLSDARDMVLTQRNFGSYAEDPAAATLAFRLRRDYLKANSHLSNTKDVYSKFNTAWHNLTGVVEELSDRTARVASIRGVNGTAGESRKALAIDLRETARSVVQAMNQKLGDHFIFGGNDALNPPFSWSEDGTILYYRGVNINAGGVPEPVSPADQPAPDWNDSDLYDTARYNDDVDRAAGIKANRAGIENNKEAIEYTREAIEGMDPETDAAEIQKWEDQIKAWEDEIEKWEGEIKEWEAELPWFWNEFNDDAEGDAARAARVEKPIDMPIEAADFTDQAWMDYWNGLGPEPSVGAEWINDEAYFDENGIPDVAAIRQFVESLADGDYNAENGLRAIDRIWMQYYNDKAAFEKDQADLDKLRAMSGEEMYIDLGMGAAEKSPNNPVKGTYFNNALCGIDFLGFGVDEDGDPLSLPLIMRELADVFDTWGENGQMYLPEEYRNKSYDDIQAILKSKDPEDMAEAARLKAYNEEQEEKAERLMDKLKAAQENTTEHWVELDANSVYLQSTQSRLEIQMDDVAMQILDVEQVDLADAITTFSWEQYCYNAALKIGNQLLSQSLIDYMS